MKLWDNYLPKKLKQKKSRGKCSFSKVVYSNGYNFGKSQYFWLKIGRVVIWYVVNMCAKFGDDWSRF